MEDDGKLILAERKKEEGNQLYKRGSYREAIIKYTEAIQICPHIPTYFTNRSACFLLVEQPKKALEDARISVNLDPTFSKGWLRMAKCCVMLGDSKTALYAIEKVIDLGGDGVQEELKNVELVNKFEETGENSLRVGKYQDALSWFDKCLKIAIYSGRIRIARTKCLVYLGKYCEAMEAVNAVILEDHTNVDAIFVRGLAYYHQDITDKAFQHFTQVLKLDPDHTGADEVIKRAMTLKQKKAEGNEAFKKGDMMKALKLYTEALAIDPLNTTINAKLYFNRGNVQAKLGNLKESVEDCTKALVLDMNYTKALLRRAKSCMELRDYDSAVADFTRLCESDRTNMEYKSLLKEAKLEKVKQTKKDYYKILGVERGASDEEIKKGYRKQAMKHHPDKHSDGTIEEKKEHEKMFKEIGQAYAILSDPKEKLMYDQEGDSGNGGRNPDEESTMDGEAIWKAFFKLKKGRSPTRFDRKCAGFL